MRNGNVWVGFFTAFLFISLASIVARSQPAYNAPTVVIGRQEWMTENLSVDHYIDGTPIPEAKSMAEWKSYDEKRMGCYCYYDDDANYGRMYGKLYNWYAVRRGIAPHCWRLPTRTDFDRLVAYAGAANAGKKLKAKHSWSNDWNGNNGTGFTAFAGGCRNPSGTFSFIGREGFWWTGEPRKTGNDRGAGLYFFINYDDNCNYDVSEDFGFSVRCMRDVGEAVPQPCP